MIYLRTGANGAGKTLLTLKEVREKSLKESRPVYYNGRFDLVADFGWKKIEAKEWESVEDGAIFLFDECHNDFPVRKGGDVPRYISQLAEHRRRGFDFFLITQHPLNLDAFVRRLIGAPGWHQHLKRASGAPLVAVLEWASVNEQCQKAGSGESGSTRMVPYPREVYAWYRSTSLDTAKVRIPKQVFVLGACALLVPAMLWGGWYSWNSNRQKQQAKVEAQKADEARAAVPGAPGGTASPGARSGGEMTPEAYVASFAPRIPALAYTAPRYDGLTQPVVAPYPAACVVFKGDCRCFTQQATRIDVPVDVCRQIVERGFFVDWNSAGNAPQSAPAPIQQQQPARQAVDPRQVIADSRQVGQVAEQPAGLFIMQATPMETRQPFEGQPPSASTLKPEQPQQQPQDQQQRQPWVPPSSPWRAG